ncbi:thiamine ABC transporter, ATP-binding protein [Xaviernesmea oryzae]|uniref:Thiamine ABC transporter, ATP-binding protein n=1 Tax=Xaviernesmea oryzae TaxID=464029 RepID=A0A1Q9AXL4_9HYPH|nr:thiamine ABC transporter ATP-binding protein [Xaviernesmea oryzae]OLP60178.1 thiamine ABC transporter, ATP-binding protein [Xaviernesmea oryzae]SEK30095.1 thiamine transport system ATP-binding protein [Xaviernesmea oryzae]
MNAAHPAIALEEAIVAFGTRHLSFDCRIDAGGITAVLGPSGSGKSTLLNLIAGFETPDRGHVTLMGQRMDDVAPSRRPVSVIFQDNNLFAHLDVTTNIGLGIDPGLKLSADDRARIGQALARVGLADYEKRRPPSLSGGERQRVALARALVQTRPILLLDEPFAALDPALRAGMSALIGELQAERQMTVLLVTHHPEDVRRLADDVLFLEEGRILLHAPREAFLQRRDLPAVAAFLRD